jgi:hypothetical protein
MRETNVYRTASGMIFRVTQRGEEYRRVEVLTSSEWIKAQPGIVGLRVSPDTVRLTARQVLALPS